MSARDAFLREAEHRLQALEAAALRRRPQLPAGIDVVSNDYLGFADHEALRQALAAAALRGPAGAGGSRLLRGHHAAFEAAEARLAQFSGTAAALLFGSGTLANHGLVGALCGPDDLVLCDAHNHASLIDAVRLCRADKRIYPHQDLDALQGLLRQADGRAPGGGAVFVLTESVFSMDGDLTALAEIVALCERHGGLLLVDEAHATGLYGARGSGRVEQLGLRERVLASVHTGGKALGLSGAWVATEPAIVELLQNRARSFVFSTAPLPALPAALCAALDLLAGEASRVAEVHRKAALLRAALAAAGVPAAGAGPIVPVVVGASEAALALAADLRGDGFDVLAVRPPTVPAGTARLRLTARSPVADDDYLRLARGVARHWPVAARP